MFTQDVDDKKVTGKITPPANRWNSYYVYKPTLVGRFKVYADGTVDVDCGEFNGQELVNYIASAHGLQTKNLYRAPTL